MSGLVTRGKIGSGSALSEVSLLRNEGGDDVAIPMPEDAAASSSTAQENIADHESMHKAASEGDWEAAATLLRRDKSLAWVEIKEQGDRALHVAVLKKHTEFVCKLIKFVGAEKLKLYDGYGYTACCYAVMAGNLKIVCAIMEANPSMRNVKNWRGTTPFALAFTYRKAHIVLYFLALTKVEDLAEVEWFHHLLDAIEKRMFDVALEILEKKATLTEMKGGDGRTALHVLAQLDISSEWQTGDDEETQADLSLLAKKLWKNIKSLGRDRMLELMECPPILHDAAKAGNLYLIKIITIDYPYLLSRVDSDGGSLLRTMVMHQRDNMLEVVKLVLDPMDFTAISLDKHGNNLLHEAARSVGLEGVDVHNLDLKMERAHQWFQAVEEIVPYYYSVMKNKKGYTPRQLFWTEHAEWLEKTIGHTKKTAESCMLISTIVMTLVFTAAFSPPGGYNQDTGLPVLFMRKEFYSFVVPGVFALFFSAMSTIGFWDIISSDHQDYQFILSIKKWLRKYMICLLFSIFWIITAFFFASRLVFFHRRNSSDTIFIWLFYVLVILGIMVAMFKVQFAKFFYRIRAKISD